MTTKYRAISAVAFAFVLAQFAIGCGGSGGAATSGAAGASAAGTGTAGAGTSGANAAGANGVIVGDGKPFVPDGIKYSLVEGGRDLTLVAATMIDDPTGGSFWVCAVRNDAGVPICSPEVNAAFTSAGHENDFSGGQAVVAVQGAMYRSDDGDLPCLNPGDVGMGVGQVVWPESGAMKTVEIDYQPRGFLSSGLVKLPGLAVGPLTIKSSAAGNVVTGEVKNNDASAAAAPIEVMIFALDSAGRPADFGYASSDAALVAGGSWSFTTTIPSPINKYVAFAVYGQSPP